MTITLRIVKGFPLTHNELDGNFTDLESKTIDADNEIITLSTTVGTHTGQISSLQSVTGTHTTQIGGLNIALSGLEDEVGDIEDRVLALETGDLPADRVSYDNLTSGATAGDAQGALDELFAALGVQAGILNNAVSLNTIQTIVASKRSAPTDANSGTINLDSGNNFVCTPTGPITLSISAPAGVAAGQSGFIKLNNTAGYTISLSTVFKTELGLASRLSAAGEYLLSYYVDSNSKISLVASLALT